MEATATLTLEKSRKNFFSFLWHAGFLALATNFMDVDTVVPAVLIQSGGGPIAVGTLTAIMLGFSKLFQLVFSRNFEPLSFKKKYLVTGIYLRMFALLLLSVSLFFGHIRGDLFLIIMIFVSITLFSVSGSLANVAYLDILGKGIRKNQRKKFFSIRQVVSSIGVLISAFAVREVLKSYAFPVNYAYAFLAAGILLFLASFGFLNISEPASRPQKKLAAGRFLKRIVPEIKKRPNLGYYLLLLNTSGVLLIFIPFMILLAKNHYEITATLIGNLIVLKVVGSLLVSIFLFFYHKKFEYKKILIFSSVLGASLPFLSLILVHKLFLFQLLFLLAGISLAAYKVAINGIFIEISNEGNRTFFAGITGAGNILTSVFPLFAGSLIFLFGFRWVFAGIALIIISGIWFAAKLDCTGNPDEISIATTGS